MALAEATVAALALAEATVAALARPGLAWPPDFAPTLLYIQLMFPTPRRVWLYPDVPLPLGRYQVEVQRKVLPSLAGSYM